MSDESFRVRDHKTWQEWKKKAASSKNPVTKEEKHRLLLNPCLDDPSKDLVFTMEYTKDSKGNKKDFQGVLVIGKNR